MNIQNEELKTIQNDISQLDQLQIKTAQSEEILFETLLPNMPRTLPTLEFDFIPREPRKKHFTPELNNRLLTRRIYLEMLKTIKMYGKLQEIAPQNDIAEITNLKNQMEILSLAMLNIYGRTAQNNKVPFFTNGGANISRDYKRALQQVYDKVYHIHNLVLRLLNKTSDSQIKSTLIIVYTNLKSQLQSLQTLINN